MTRLRKRIAERLKEAQNTAAMLTTFNEVDMTATMEMRARYQDSFTKKHGIKLGFMGFFVKAAVEALKAYPAVNAEIDGDEVVYKHHYDIGVAVSTEQGLVVPVVRDADAMSFAEHREEDRRPRQARPRRQARHGGPDRRHLHHHQWRRVRLDAEHPHPQPAPGRHPGHARDQAAGRW